MLCCDRALQLLASRHHHLASWCSTRLQALHQMQSRRSFCDVQVLHRASAQARTPSQLPPCFLAPNSRPAGWPPSTSFNVSQPAAASAAALFLPHASAAPKTQILTAAHQPLPPSLVLMAATKQQQQQPQPPRGSKSQNDQDKEAIERLKSELSRLQSRRAIKYNNPCKVSANYSKSCTLYELTAVKYHLEEFIPRFFVNLMDYAIFTPDVVYINEMRTQPKISKGVYRLSLDRLKLKLYYDMRYAMKRPIILRIDTDQANSSMAVRLRVRCMSGAKPFTNFGEMNRVGVAQFVEQNGEWHDYLLHVHVTDDARIWQLRITNLTEDKGENPIQAARLSLLQRLRMLLRRRARLPSPV